MSSSKYNPDILGNMLPIYYKRFFPHSLFYRWLSYGNALTFAKREISFTLFGDIYIRYQSFDTQEEFTKQLYKKYPVKIDIGAVYHTKPKDKVQSSQIKPVEKELVFDIDVTDYNDVRSCCSGDDICPKCWKFMVIACRILERALFEDFGFRHRLWTFSGRRGIHCWVCDQKARNYDQEVRSVVADYLHVVQGGLKCVKKVNLPEDKIHTSLLDAVAIIDKYFITIVEEQDILGTDEKFNNFLQMMHQVLRPSFEAPMKRAETSLEKWNIFEKIFDDMLQNNKIPKHSKNLKEELKLYYCYPRLDLNVTKGFTHLLKSPFCVHPKTGKVCIPINPKNIDKFDPTNVPTINGLMDELDKYAKKIKDEAKSSMETGAETIPNIVKLKDYEKTSLLEPVNIFESFLKSLEIANSARVPDNSLDF